MTDGMILEAMLTILKDASNHDAKVCRLPRVLLSPLTAACDHHDRVDGLRVLV